MHHELGDSLLIAPSRGISNVDEYGSTPLHHAVVRNDPNLMEQLLIQGADIDAIDSAGSTALHIAVRMDQPQCVRVLVRYHCNVNLQDCDGNTALHIMINFLKLRAIHPLLNCESLDLTLQNKRGFNVLHCAVNKGNPYIVLGLLKHAPYLVDVKDKYGFSPLHMAAMEGHRNVAVVLLAQHATVDLLNNEQYTPLHLAIEQQHWSLVELFVVHYNADISKANCHGNTALHIAISSSLTEFITLPPTSKSSEESPFIYRIWQNLARQGAKTELALACFLARMDESCALLEYARGRFGRTPLDLLKYLVDPSEFPLLSNLLKFYNYYGKLRIENSTN